MAEDARTTGPLRSLTLSHFASCDMYTTLMETRGCLSPAPLHWCSYLLDDNLCTYEEPGRNTPLSFGSR